MNKFRMLRDRLGVSQNEFATIIGIPLKTIQSWESGRRTPPDYVYSLINRCIIMDDRYEDSRNPVLKMEENLEFEQALISKKQDRSAFSVEREYINSKAYHDKFDKIPVNRDVQQSLYMAAGKLLEHVDSLKGEEKTEERMIAINARTGEYLVDNLERQGDTYKTGFNDEEYKKVSDCRDSVILLHNHSFNGRPSGTDLLTYLHDDKIKLSLILCHDGTVYGIYQVTPKFEEIYTKKMDNYKQMTNDTDEIKRLSMTDMYILNEQLTEKNKLFICEKL